MNATHWLAAIPTAIALLPGAAPAQAQGTAPWRPRRAGPAVKAATPVTLNFVNADIEAVTRHGRDAGPPDRHRPTRQGRHHRLQRAGPSARDAYLNYLAALRGWGSRWLRTLACSRSCLSPMPKLQTGAVATEPTRRWRPDADADLPPQPRKREQPRGHVLRPLISPNNTINANPGNNTLVITDYADNLQRIAKIIAAMDTPGAGDIELVPLSTRWPPIWRPWCRSCWTASPRPAVRRRRCWRHDRAGGPALERPDPARAQCRPPGRHARAMVEKLDQPGLDAGTSIRVVYLKNADAVKLATVLRGVWWRLGAGGGTSGSYASPHFGHAARQHHAERRADRRCHVRRRHHTGGPERQPRPTGGFVQADPPPTR